LNADKTKTIWFGLRSNLARLHRIKQSLHVTPSGIQPNSIVRDLDVYLDSELTMKQHIAKTSAACFYHIHRLRQVRRRVGQEVTQQLVMTFITSTLDYCNTCWQDYRAPHWSHFNEYRIQLVGWSLT